MPSEIVNSRIIPEQGQEVVEVMDDFGTELHIYIAVTDSVNRQAHIDQGIASQNTAEAALKAYALTHNIDLTALLAAGAVQKTAAKAQG